jgi:hypothetical protein
MADTVQRPVEPAHPPLDPRQVIPVSEKVPNQQVRAVFTDRTITVYQAYSPAIADPAGNAGRFVAPFKRDRMTWIKPSLLWMAYRSGWASKPGQERILAIEITRAGFEWALAHSCLSRFDRAVHITHDRWKEQLANSPVRIQWDPERSLTLQPLPHRTIQIGIGGRAVDYYVEDWIVGITDITMHVQHVHEFVRSGDHDRACALLPNESP